MADRSTRNALLRAVREDQFQMSRQEFAAAVVEAGEDMGETVGCTSRLVAAWEDGQVRLPRAVYRRILTRMTGGRTMAQLGFRLGPAAMDGEADAGRIGRRALLVDGAGVAVSLPLAPLDGPGRVGVAHVRAIHSTAAVLYDHDSGHGSGPLRRAAAEALHTAYRWLHEGRHTEATGRRLRSAVGYLSIAAGWLAFDSGRAADARSLYGEALAAARVADDGQLEAHAFGCMSGLAKASGRPREAVAAAQGAQSAARLCGSPRLLALMTMREAAGWALLGDRSAADRSIVDSHRHYAQGPRDADPGWLAFFTPGELAGLEGIARADLGQHDRAAAGAEQAVLLSDGYTRNRALYEGDVAIQHAIKGRPDVDAATEAAHRALAYLPDVRSDRLLQQLHTVDSALQRHAAVPVVADWREAYRCATGS